MLALDSFKPRSGALWHVCMDSLFLMPNNFPTNLKYSIRDEHQENITVADVLLIWC